MARVWSTSRMRKPIVLMMALILAACSSNATEGTTTTTAVIPTTAPADTTTTAPTSTTTAALTTTTTIPTTTTTKDPRAPEGSGCTPGSEVLPDGEWYGAISAFDDQTISFDLACLFTGEAAVAASAEDGEESPPPNDYYVRNQNDEVRVLMVDADTPVTWYTSGDPNDEVTGTYAEWIAFLATQEFHLGVWVTIESGSVTEIAEWWVP
ncbi:MAG: hypothetical protein PVF87_03840 [Acidimicrobiia bacterium]